MRSHIIAFLLFSSFIQPSLAEKKAIEPLNREELLSALSWRADELRQRGYDKSIPASKDLVFELIYEDLKDDEVLNDGQLKNALSAFRSQTSGDVLLHFNEIGSRATKEWVKKSCENTFYFLSRSAAELKVDKGYLRQFEFRFQEDTFFCEATKNVFGRVLAAHGEPQGIAYLVTTMEKGQEAIHRVVAAQVLLSNGEHKAKAQEVLEKMLVDKNVDSTSKILAARYLDKAGIASGAEWLSQFGLKK